MNGIVTTICVALAAWIPCGAQPPINPLVPVIEPLETANVLRSISDAYAAGPWSEDMRIAILRNGAEIKADTIRVNADPGDGSTRPLRFLVELESVRIFAESRDGASEVLAIYTRDPASFLRIEIEGSIRQALDAADLPPIPLPQCDLMHASDQEQVTPYATAIQWVSAERVSSSLDDSIILRGHHRRGDIKICTNPETMRPFRITINSAADETSIELTMEDVAPSDPSSWRIDTAGRIAVASLAELRRRPGDVVDGQIVPDLYVQAVDGSSWRPMIDLTRPVSNADPTTLKQIGIFMVRERFIDPGSGPAPPAITESMEALKSIVARSDRQRLLGRIEHGQTPIPFSGGRIVAVLDAADAATMETVARISEIAGASLLWTASSATSIDRFAPDADAVLVVVNDSQKIIRILPVLATEDPAAARQRVESAMVKRQEDPESD